MLNGSTFILRHATHKYVMVCAGLMESIERLNIGKGWTQIKSNGPKSGYMYDKNVHIDNESFIKTTLLLQYLQLPNK